MTSIAIRKLKPQTKAALRLTAAKHGHSMEEEARQILDAALDVNGANSSDDWILGLRQLLIDAGVDELPIPVREKDIAERPIPTFD